MRAARHDVGRGGGTKLSGSVRRRADPQFWQVSARSPKRSRPRLSLEAAAAFTAETASALDHVPAGAHAAAPHGPQAHRHRERRGGAGQPATTIGYGRNEVTGSTQMSKSGSIRVSAEISRPTSFLYAPISCFPVETCPLYRSQWKSVAAVAFATFWLSRRAFCS